MHQCFKSYSFPGGKRLISRTNSDSATPSAQKMYADLKVLKSLSWPDKTWENPSGGKKKRKPFLHNVCQHGKTRGDEHDGALDGVVVADHTLHSQVHEHSRHQPDSEHREQSAQDLWAPVGRKQQRSKNQGTEGSLLNEVQ